MYNRRNRIIETKVTTKYHILIALVFLVNISLFSQAYNIHPYGIEDSILSKKYPTINSYRSNINFPPFINWDIKGEKMLFNGVRVMYSMKRNNSEIKEHKEFNRNLSSYLSPNQTQFLYLEDEDGNEEYQVFLFDIITNKSIKISSKGDKSYDPFWSSDSKQIVYKSNKRNPAEIDLYLKSISNLKSEQLIFKNFSDDGQIYDWSSEKNQMLAVKVISENNKLLYLINDKTGVIEDINPKKENIAYSDAKFIPNQNACFIISDEFSEFLELHHYNLAQKKFTRITANIPWNVEALTIDKTGTRAAFSVNKNGTSELYILNLKTLLYSQVKSLPKGIIENLVMNPQGTEVGFNFYSSKFKRKVYSYDLKKDTLFWWRRNGKEQNDSINFIEAKQFNYKSFDNENRVEYSIPAYIYKSKGRKKPSPVFIDIHGGPEYQIRPKFNNFYQYLVNELGVTVVIPNIRGSNGYGKTYMKQDDGLNRINAIKDVGALLDWIKTQDYLDENNVAIYGESYGGYVVLAALAEYPNQIKCGIDVVGISNWITYLTNTSDYRRDLRRVEFGDERHKEMRNFLEEISPINHVEKIVSPILIFQGLKDPRVNYKESQQMYEALNSQNKEVWYVLAKNEGHGFKQYKNYLLQKNLIISFLKKHLKNIKK